MGEGFVNDMETRRLLVLAAERGWLRSYILFINNRPVAFDTALQYKNCFYLQNGGYDPAFSEIEPGINLFLGYLAELIDDGNIQCVDFGFGDAQYKRHICNESWNEESVYLFAPTLKAILLNLILTLNARLTKHISMLLRKSALYEKVKKFWRNRLTTKPRSQN
jgi:CelD/BcsL family acetyltransferase involved in cellulose biosynthesis